MQSFKERARRARIVITSALVLPGTMGAAYAIAPATGPATTPPTCSAPAVITTSGRFCGVTQKLAAGGGKFQSVRAYLGIRYGTAGRFQKPLPVTATGLNSATQLGNVCPQDPANLPPDAPVSEDCLFLNVWSQGTPPVTPLPVLVFIHGGGFQEGASSQAVFMGARLAATGRAIVITMNYRLGALGFLTGGVGPDQIPPNLGLADQFLAMQWIHDNAQAFGGDPSRITLFGESAGAMSIGAHLTNPNAEPLFNSAIMESNPYALTFKNAIQAGVLRTSFNNTITVANACTTPAAPPGSLACLKSMTFADIVQAQGQVSSASDALHGQVSGLLTWNPQVDGDLVPIQPNEAVITKPVIAGTNQNEGNLFIPFTANLSPTFYNTLVSGLFGKDTAAAIYKLPRYAPDPTDNRQELANIVNDYLFTCATRHVLSAAKSANYAYLFTHRPTFDVWPSTSTPLPCRSVASGGQGLVCHSFELPYVFRNAVPVNAAATPGGRVPVPPGTQFTAAEWPLVRTISQYWTSFAASDVPTDASNATPKWPIFSKWSLRQVLDVKQRQTKDLTMNCGFWDTVGYDRGTGLLEGIVEAK